MLGYISPEIFGVVMAWNLNVLQCLIYLRLGPQLMRLLGGSGNISK